MNLELLILISGILHFGTLLASFTVPKVLDWTAELNKLDKLTRQLIWAHGLFIVLIIIGFGLVTFCFAGDLASGSTLARGICGFIALFWLVRLVIQFFVFDARPYLTSPFLKLGYHGLTFVFTYHFVVLGWAAFGVTS